MYKILAASALVMGLATSAFAQSAVTDSNSQYDPNTGYSQQQMAPADPSVDTMTTQGIMSQDTTIGITGSSSAGTNEYCPPGTPGAGAQGMPTGSGNPACNN